MIRSAISVAWSGLPASFRICIAALRTLIFSLPHGLQKGIPGIGIKPNVHLRRHIVGQVNKLPTAKVYINVQGEAIAVTSHFDCAGFGLL